MATASRSRAPAGAKPQRSRVPLAALGAVDALRSWGIPGLLVVAIAVLAALSAAELMPTPTALAGTIAAALLLLLYIGERPLVTGAHSLRDRALGAALAAVWFAACYLPFHARLFPGRALVDGAQVSASGEGLPLRIPAAGARAVDLLLEGKLTPNPTGGTAPPVRYVLTFETAAGPRSLDGLFEDRLATRRLGRRGTAVVHQTHTADVRLLPNPGRGEITVTHVVLEPETAQAITISAFVHPLPSTLVLALATAVLLGAVIAFDRRGPVAETDGALTLSTAAALGTALIFWTSNAVHPDYPALIGSIIFGGPIGFAAGAILWWTAKRLIVRPAR
jgi:hypothetical protein